MPAIALADDRHNRFHHVCVFADGIWREIARFWIEQDANDYCEEKASYFGNTYEYKVFSWGGKPEK